MRRHVIGATTLALVMLAGVLAQMAPAAAAKTYGQQLNSYVVKTKHGKVYVEVNHPVEDGKIVKGPVILTYSPYSVLGRDNGRDRWTPKGYHVAFADVIGTGNSGGCYDYGGKRDKESGAQLVDWLGTQKWSTGKVGMIGGSYNGTTQWAAAVEHPKHLTTIVPEASIVRWYDYAYSGGIRYLLNNENPADEGVDTPLAFDFGLALPPPIDVGGEDWAERVQDNITPCEELEHMQHGYDDTPDYDKFWVERDYLRDLDTLTLPVLVAANWGDWNVKQEESWLGFQALKNAEKRVLYMGTRFEGHGTPGGEYDQTVDKWFDHYLMGIDNGIDKMPSIVSETSNADGPLEFLKANKVPTTNVDLIAQEVPKTDPNDPTGWKLLPMQPMKTALMTPAQFPSTNINTEAHMNHHMTSNHDWFFFMTPALTRDVRIFGQPKVKMQLQIDREWITLTPTIVDIDPACHMNAPVAGHVADPRCTPNAGSYTPGLNSVTRGWLDTRYRNGLSKQVPLEPNKPFDVTVVEKPTDYVFKKGHHIALQIATEINEWSIPKPYPCSSAGCINLRVLWEKGGTKVTLPIVGKVGDPMSLFDFGGHHH